MDWDSAAKHRHGPSFSLANRLSRVAWGLCWLLLARWTPPPLHRWRCGLLRLWGAEVGRDVRVYGSVRIWHPANLAIGPGSVLGPRVRCYNQGRITIGAAVVVSQDASLCASTHDVTDPCFPLLLRPIDIGDHAWIAAEAFVGPGVQLGTGAVLGARGVAMRDLAAWTVFSGNPAQPLKLRQPWHE
ncbi:putative colanic acid biosynthesis acetyltransferase [Sphingomonas sp. PL-96]|uniref:putative colanic acid biosynthesis acetyltransferase n=1 Tax=Sphingomonas sp. PL-96 TaxID=2887201 RepID=UPI001E425591|nr:putative colanic acid biosynthesis acetyltransferase [Sphingomonas sp. PL-96]MCC2975514.1 putative colanic acid biosynthesis acetyltransferase [Sphingomonas sp. PL-96]